MPSINRRHRQAQRDCMGNLCLSAAMVSLANSSSQHPLYGLFRGLQGIPAKIFPSLRRALPLPETESTRSPHATGTAFLHGLFLYDKGSEDSNPAFNHRYYRPGAASPYACAAMAGYFGYGRGGWTGLGVFIDSVLPETGLHPAKL